MKREQLDDEVLMREYRRNKKVGIAPALCNILGTLILLVVIASCLPMVIPRFLGYEIYNVVSGSMEPEIPVGSVLYVEPTEPEDLEEGDIIAFDIGNGVIAHRVVTNHIVEGEFTTKGDANATEDMNRVDYDAVIGKVVHHYPVLGTFMEIFTTNVGKVYILIFAACGAMLNLLAGRIRASRRR